MEKAPDTRWVRYIGPVTERLVERADWHKLMGADDDPDTAHDVTWTRRTGHMVPRGDLGFLTDETLERFMRSDGNFVMVDTDEQPLPEGSTVTDTRNS